LFETRRLNDADGNFAGVVVGTIDLRYFESLFAPVDVGSLGSIAILTDDGTLIARKPRKPYGSSLHNWAIFSDPLRFDAAGTYLRDSATDGVLRLTAFVRLGQFPVVVTVALAQSQFLAPWYARALWETIVLIGMLVVIAALAAGLLRQIDDIKRGEAQSARLALLDGLTGIANRRQFDSAIERDWRRSIREQTPLSLLMIDVDNFKAYNDANGHQHGDDVLVLIARSIADNIVRSSDLAARYGGEEFAVILLSTDTEDATIVAERLRRSVLALGIPHVASSCGVITISVGIASTLPSRADGWHDFVRVADEALYAAKGAGRNGWAVGSLSHTHAVDNGRSPRG
jgi:diguanylate cyclase (GGDEF)-like protein